MWMLAPEALRIPGTIWEQLRELLLLIATSEETEKESKPLLKGSATLEESQLE